VGYEQVYRNGVLLSRGNDYTATDGNSITLIDATIAGDIIEVFANELVPLTDAISKGQFTAKGALLSATAASTPAVLTVGSNDQVLTADSTTSTGLKWADAAGGMTLINTVSASNSATVEFTSIPATYRNLVVYVRNFKPATDAAVLYFRFNSDSTANRHSDQAIGASATTAQTFGGTFADISLGNDNSVANGFIRLELPDYANTTTWKTGLSFAMTTDETTTTSYKYRNRLSYYNQTGAISSLQFLASSGNITSGDFLLYGVK
jgi:hypothetical protein